MAEGRKEKNKLDLNIFYCLIERDVRGKLDLILLHYDAYSCCSNAS